MFDQVGQSSSHDGRVTDFVQTEGPYIIKVIDKRVTDFECFIHYSNIKMLKIITHLTICVLL